MFFDHVKSLCLSAAIFALLIFCGYSLSQHKTLWFDEIYSQTLAIEPNSFAGILSLKFPDGNKNPLFYMIQKAVCKAYAFHFPYQKDFAHARNITAQIILRIPSNVYMSLALALIFYFFTRFFSVFAAFYALVVALVSPMVWMYWVEARPYSLWFLLTTVQVLLLSCTVIAPKIKTVNKLFWTHLLLALTTPTSMIQICIAALFLWWKNKYNKKELAFIWALPFLIAVIYYFFDIISKIRTYMFFLNLFDVVMPEHFYVYIFYALVTWLLPEKQKKFFANAFFLPIFLLFLASGVSILFIDIFRKISDQGFFSRYIIYLTPADIVMFSLASFDLRRWSRQNPWICLNVSILLAGLLMMRGLMTYRDVLSSAIYLHSPG